MLCLVEIINTTYFNFLSNFYDNSFTRDKAFRKTKDVTKNIQIKSQDVFCLYYNQATFNNIYFRNVLGTTFIRGLTYLNVFFIFI